MAYVFATSWSTQRGWVFTGRDFGYAFEPGRNGDPLRGVALDPVQTDHHGGVCPSSRKTRRNTTMKIAKIVLLSAAVAALAACEKNAPDTAVPTDAPATETPAASDDLLGDDATDEATDEEATDEEAPADEAEGEGE
jgi:hypothetical protein